MTVMQPVPVEIVRLVKEYVSRERDDAEKWENRELLDDSGVYSLHSLARQIYAAGWTDGYQASAEARRP